MSYTELQVTSNFSFLRGGSHPEELVARAHELGHEAIAITDRNTLAGIVRAHSAARKVGIRFIPACRLDLLDGPSLLAYPSSKEAYGQLSSLLTIGNRRAKKGECHLEKADVYAHARGSLFIAVPPNSLNADFDIDEAYKAALREYKRNLGDALYLGATCNYTGDDGKKLYRLSQLAESMRISLVALNDVHYHIAERRELQDVLTCIREKCTIQTAGYRLNANAERYLKSATEMERLFKAYPDAIKQTEKIAEACQFSLDSLEYVYPEEVVPKGFTPQQYLTKLAWDGARKRFSEYEDIPKKIQTSLLEELRFFKRKNYAAYFLTVYDFVDFARREGILCQGRGSAANSVVCYCLGISAVNPMIKDIRLLFARFMSDARNEPPDIDVDFEHERREEVMQYIYNRYGRDRAGIVATVTQVHQKGAIRDVAKAMGLSIDAVNRLAGSTWAWSSRGMQHSRVAEQGFSLQDSHLQKVLELTDQYIGFPRQLGQHTGGFVITQGKLFELCPILNARMENRTCIEWNKDDIEALGFLKVDVLALGMLTCIRKAFDLLKSHHGISHTLASIPQEDPKVYEMISHADTIGVFQIESRAQMSMLPRLKPNCFYDLVIEVAIVRPGPIQGDMVHPYLRRREGKENWEPPSEELRQILDRTLGVPLFQEQAMEIAIVAAGFTPAEADGLRRSMATFKAKGKVSDWEKKLVSGMMRNNYSEDFAKRVFRQLEGFGSYGFPESHAASFALLVYVSSWMKCHYPDVFACALLNSMPMGFYQPAQIVIDAQKHGITVLPVDINHSTWDNLLEAKVGAYCPLRLGFRQVKGLMKEEMDVLVSARKNGFDTIPALLDAGISQATIEKLADADAFRSIGLDRRAALWEVAALADKPIGMYEGLPSESAYEARPDLPLMSLPEHVVQDYSTTSLSLKAHPVSFLREKLRALHILSAAELNQYTDGTRVKVAGLILVRQRPGTASGICFITIEDETGVANLVVFNKFFERFRKEILSSSLLMVEGKLQREGEVTHVVLSHCYNFSGLLQEMVVSEHRDASLLTLSRADEKDGNALPSRLPKGARQDAIQGKIFPEGRNFK
jgi:error-prone DNA polymerase